MQLDESARARAASDKQPGTIPTVLQETSEADLKVNNSLTTMVKEDAATTKANLTPAKDHILESKSGEISSFKKP